MNDSAILWVAALSIGPGSGAPISVDVKSIMANPVDDQWVSLKGHILEKIGGETYTFSHSTDSGATHPPDICR